MTSAATLISTQDATASQRQRRLTIGLCINIVAIAFESIAVATAMPAAARDLDGLSYYSWSFSLFLVGMLFSTVLAGRLSDRIGPARPLLMGLAVFAVGLVLAGSAQHISQLIAGRLVQGLGSGLINTAIFVCVARAYSDAQRPRMFTYISASWVLPAFVGPPVAAAITERWSWHWVFLSVIPVVVLGGVMALPELRRLVLEPGGGEGESARARPAPLWAAAVVALAAVGLQLAGQRLGWTSLTLLIVAGAGLVVGLPRLMPGCFSRLGRGLPAVIVVRGLLAGAFVGGEAFIPLMLVEEKNTPLLWAGAALTIGSLGWMAGSWLQSRTWLRLRRDRIITVGCGSVVASLIWVAISAAPSTPAWWVAGGWILAGFGMGLATASTALAVTWLSRESEQGRNGSSLNLSDALGSALFVGVSGTLFAALRSGHDGPFTFRSVLLTMSAVALLALAASFRITPLTDPTAARTAIAADDLRLDQARLPRPAAPERHGDAPSAPPLVVLLHPGPERHLGDGDS
jgi:MFS family permease